jgi:hypothetical protein
LNSISLLPVNQAEARRVIEIVNSVFNASNIIVLPDSTYDLLANITPASAATISGGFFAPQKK